MDFRPYRLAAPMCALALVSAPTLVNAAMPNTKVPSKETKAANLTAPEMRTSSKNSRN